MNRSQKLSKLENKSRANQAKYNSDRQNFLKQFTKTVNTFKDTFEGGVELNGLDSLLTELENLNNLRPVVEELKNAIEKIDIPTLPNKVKIDGLNSLLAAIQQINKAEVKVDLKPLEIVSKKLDKLTKAVDESKAPKQGQKPTDFIPMRRVVYVSGKTPMFDDSFYTGGGGGGSTFPQEIIEEGRIKVSNGTIVPETYDYIAMSYPNDSTEVATYKINGVSGTVVATVTTTYTDSTKELLSSIART